MSMRHLLKLRIKTCFSLGIEQSNFFAKFTVVDTVAPTVNHFKTLSRNMPDESFDKPHTRDGFSHINVILVPVVMESYVFTVMTANT